MNMSPYILISFDLLARAVLTSRNPLRVKVKIVEGTSRHECYRKCQLHSILFEGIFKKDFVWCGPILKSLY